MEFTEIQLPLQGGHIISKVLHSSPENRGARARLQRAQDRADETCEGLEDSCATVERLIQEQMPLAFCLG